MLDRLLPGPKHLEHRVDPPQAAEVVITVREVNVGEAAEAVKVNLVAVVEVKVKVTVEVTAEVSVIEVGVARAGWCA